jgi:acetyl-CoA synthetase
MKGYYGDRAREDDVFVGGWYLTGDVARMDGDGYFWFVGRNDDVFKSADYRISPFEVECELLSHPAVAEAAVIGSHDDARNGLVPKVFVALHPGFEACRETALDVFRFARRHLAPYKRPRRLEFMSELMKTISGKIRRAELRNYDDALRRAERRSSLEYMESDFPDELGSSGKK